MNRAQHPEGAPLPVLEPTKVPRSDRSASTAEEKLARLDERLRDLVRDGLVVAFSGGVDSAFLLWAAWRACDDTNGQVLALTVGGESVPGWDLEDAVRFAEELGVEHVVRPGTELALPEYVRNDENRCYYCKAELVRMAAQLARESGMRWIADGYTASDRHDVRPGHRAGVERGVLSPLAEVDLTKEDLRALMRVHGLDLAEKPGSPCLSSRIMTGVAITRERLDDVECIERILRNAGITVCRVRVCDAQPGSFLRIEVAPEEMERVLPLRRGLVRAAEERGYRWVTLDLAGYKMGGGRT